MVQGFVSTSCCLVRDCNTLLVQYGDDGDDGK
jgi:hypothetical protein